MFDQDKKKIWEKKFLFPKQYYQKYWKEVEAKQKKKKHKIERRKKICLRIRVWRVRKNELYSFFVVVAQQEVRLSLSSRIFIINVNTRATTTTATVLTRYVKEESKFPPTSQLTSSIIRFSKICFVFLLT